MSFETWRRRQVIKWTASDLEDMQGLRAFAEAECKRLQAKLIREVEHYESAVRDAEWRLEEEG